MYPVSHSQAVRILSLILFFSPSLVCTVDGRLYFCFSWQLLLSTWRYTWRTVKYISAFFAFPKGSPYVAPSEIVQKIMERLREHDSHEVDASSSHHEQYGPSHQNGRLSVLSPDNRQFLEQPRSKSPDMRNKRMIIGKRGERIVGTVTFVIDLHREKNAVGSTRSAVTPVARTIYSCVNSVNKYRWL